MATTTHVYSPQTDTILKKTTVVTSNSDQVAYQTLHLILSLAPIIVGVDKFLNIAAYWPQYLAPFFTDMIEVTPTTFMRGIGVIEIIVGFGVMLKPKIFSFVLGAWMVGIILNLFMLGNYYDIALRDLGLGCAAFALGMLAQERDF